MRFGLKVRWKRFSGSLFWSGFVRYVLRGSVLGQGFGGYVLRGCVLGQGFGGYVFRDSVLVRFCEVRFERVCFGSRFWGIRFSG